MGLARIRCAIEKYNEARDYFGGRVKIVTPISPRWGEQPTEYILSILEDGAPDGDAECIFTKHDDGSVTHTWRKVE